MFKISSRFLKDSTVIIKCFCNKNPNDAYIQLMYDLWTKDPKNVHETWNIYFQSGKNKPPETKHATESKSKKITTENPSPSIKPAETPASETQIEIAYNVPTTTPVISPTQQRITAKRTSLVIVDSILVDIEEQSWLYKLISLFQNHAHYIANIDPINLNIHGLKERKHTEDKINFYRDKIPPEKEFKIPTICFVAEKDEKLQFKEIYKRLRRIYCHTMGIETKYTNNLIKKTWIQKRLEYPRHRLTKMEKLVAFKRLLKTSQFDAFMTNNWADYAPLSITGLESVIPAIGQIIDTSSVLGVDRVIIGMECYGRLNVIAHILKKPLNKIFAFYKDNLMTTGMGSSNEYLNLTSHKNVRISISASAQHLESVVPIVIGKARGKMLHRGDLEGKTVLPIIIHEDSAFSSQGVSFEVSNFTKIASLSSLGTIHIVMNAQVSGSTISAKLRSSIYSTSVSRVGEASVIHVNADDVENVVYSAKVVAELRALFHSDVVLDIVGYKRTGDGYADPKITEPLMYTKIENIRPVVTKYYKKLKGDNIITEHEYNILTDIYNEYLEQEYVTGNEDNVSKDDWIESPWDGFFQGRNKYHCAPTGILESSINKIAHRIYSFPEKFEVSPSVSGILRERRDLMEARVINWAMAEGIAFGSLLKDGIHVRLSGQNVESGGYESRRYVLHHYKKTKVIYEPLSNIYADQATCIICNSPVSQSAVVGYNIGYSSTSPNDLVVWDATYGDFANYAQVMIDHYIVSSEDLWLRQTGIVLLLPHGMEGDDAEHSNARPERYLFLTNDDPETIPDLEDPLFGIKQLRYCNIIVANCTTPANYFHILRRQILLPFRKPLILFTPKELMRQKECRSSFDDIAENTEFQRVLPETGTAKDNINNVKKLIFCSGRVYYDLLAARKLKNVINEVAIIRIEQLSPFPYDLIKKELEHYKDVKEILWVQEEHRNHGPWYFIETRFHFLGVDNLMYVGRTSSAVPAVGNKSRHEAELKTFLDEALNF